MNAAEFATIREGLGVSVLWLSEWLGVSERTIKHWEDNQRPIPGDKADALYDLEMVTVGAEQRAMEDPRSLERGHVWITYRTDADYREDDTAEIAYPPKAYEGGAVKHLPASWHRALVYRLRCLVGGQVSYYVPKEERI